MLTRLGEAPEGTHLLVGNLEKLMDIWKKISSINGVFDDYTSGNPEGFVQLFISRNTWWLERDDGLGILYLTMLQPGLSAMAHIVYWDKRLRGKEAFTLNSLLFAVNRFDLKKVNVSLPDFAHSAIAFVERLGFKREGYLRNWSYCNGKLYGVYWYGMTREEVLNGAGSIPDSVQDEQSTAIRGDGGPIEAIHGSGSIPDGGSEDPVRPGSPVGDERVDSSEPSGHPGDAGTDPSDG